MEPANFFVLRTPLLPFETLMRLSEEIDAPEALGDPSCLRGAWSRDRALFRQRLQALVRTPLIRDAIFVASPDLDQAIDRWLTSPADPRSEATERAVMKYVARMAFRSTPFGLFAGSGVGTIGETTCLAVGARATWRRHTRLDMDHLVALADAIARDPASAPAVRYTPNSSLYRSGDRWRFVETTLQDKIRSQHLIAVDDSTAVASTIERARGGATRDALAAALVDEDITADEADAFVGALIDGQILLPDMECQITGCEPLVQMINLLQRAPEGEPVARELAHVAESLESLDHDGLGAEPARYRAIAHDLEAFPVKVDLTRLFQVDLVRPPFVATLGRALVAEIIHGVDVLRRLSPVAGHDRLHRFRAAFAERYDHREVPLVEALDEESGVGAALGEGANREASPLLRGLDFPSPPVSTLSWGSRETQLLRRVGHALMAGAREIALTCRDIDEMATSGVPPLPDACSIMATLIPKADDGSQVDRVLLHSVSGPSGASLLGRFCHADPDLLAHVSAHLREEEALDPDAIFAEVVHLPEERLGNILLRPVLRSREISYLGRSGAPPDQQIPVTDLTLRLDGDRFVLRSRQLGRRIVPRLTSAHNFTWRTLNLYRFLCLLQSQGRVHGCAWDWGALAALPFLPRVTYGRLVFARAAWRVTRDDIDPLKDAANGAAQYAAFQGWRAARRLPRWVVLTDADNTLPVDLDNGLAIDSLIHLLKGRESATLTEMFPGPDELCAKGDDGRYLHELLIPCVARPRSAARAPAPSPRRCDRTSIQRTFAPGSEWVFAKLYTSASTADRLLSEVIGPVSKALLSKRSIDRWFFVRYADPDEHLRWRLHVAGKTHAASVQRRIERVVAQALDEGLVRRFVFDTYEREIERYGGEAGIDAAERYFWADSEAIVRLLDPVSGIGSSALRWQTAIAGTEALLSDLGFDLDAKLQLMRKLREIFGREFHADAPFARQLAAKYRAVRPDLDRLLDSGRSDASTQWRDVFTDRSTRAQQALAALHAAEQSESLDAPIAVLAESYVHMHLNRVFRAEQRAQELVVYDFLSCAYESRLARRRAGGAGRGTAAGQNFQRHA
jgi:thiopeptide-type bacteriocin biosynthesis protein